MPILFSDAKQVASGIAFEVDDDPRATAITDLEHNFVIANVVDLRCELKIEITVNHSWRVSEGDMVASLALAIGGHNDCTGLFRTRACTPGLALPLGQANGVGRKVNPSFQTFHYESPHSACGTHWVAPFETEEIEL